MTQTFEAMRLLSDAKRSGIKYGDIADYMRVSPSLVSMWLHGNAIPSRSQMRDLRKIGKAKWAVIKLYSTTSTKAIYATSIDPASFILSIMERDNKTAAGAFYQEHGDDFKHEVMLRDATRSEANTVKKALTAMSRALDNASVRSHLSRTRSGEPHTRPARIGAACVSPSAAAPTSPENENS